MYISKDSSEEKVYEKLQKRKKSKLTAVKLIYCVDRKATVMYTSGVYSLNDSSFSPITYISVVHTFVLICCNV